MGEGRALRYRLARRGYRWGLPLRPRVAASRQVAAEALAADAAEPSRQLVEWYEDGWQWYGVRCRYDALGDEYEASLWGIDDAEYAEREIKVEMALDVADQLEKAGFTVTGKPENAGG